MRIYFCRPAINFKRSKMTVWNQATFCLITGASRGLGREIAIQFSNKVKDDSVFLLLATNKDMLDETKSLMNNKVRVICGLADLSVAKTSLFDELIHKALIETHTMPEDFENVMIIHNAGSLGDITKSVAQFDNSEELFRYYSLNVFSFVTLNTIFFRIFTADKCCHRYIINISSLAAIQPMNGFGMYCCGKAARESLMNVLALEDPDLKILSYAPGPLQTAMTGAIKETAKDDVKEVFKAINLLTCEESVRKLVKILEDNKFKSGDRIDFYDV